MSPYVECAQVGHRDHLATVDAQVPPVRDHRGFRCGCNIRAPDGHARRGRTARAALGQRIVGPALIATPGCVDRRPRVFDRAPLARGALRAMVTTHHQGRRPQARRRQAPPGPGWACDGAGWSPRITGLRRSPTGGCWRRRTGGCFAASDRARGGVVRRPASASDRRLFSGPTDPMAA